MKVLVTGSDGFIGKNLIERLNRFDDLEIITFSKSDARQSLSLKIKEADFIFHLAGVNRPDNPKEFYEGNRDLTQLIVEEALQTQRKIPILMTSSTQVKNESDYGKSKLEAELEIQSYVEISGAVCYIYRLPNVFGKWSRPNYNTVIATWCHNITRKLPVEISDENAEIFLVYIDDAIEHFVGHLEENGKEGLVYKDVSPVYKKSLGEIKELIISFSTSRKSLIVQRVGNGFERALYATYLSFLPIDDFAYELQGNKDERGTFFEFLKTLDSGQVSISTTQPGIKRGAHYHNTKNEKFIVVKGKASIKQRHIHSKDVIEFNVSDKKMEVVEMIPGYTHDITNTGKSELILLLWSNEIYNHEKPDTFLLTV